MKELEKAKRQYQLAEVPPQLEFAVRTAVRRGNKKRGRTWMKTSLCVAASLCFLFVAVLNTSSAFAQAMASMPVLGGVARVLTFRSYHEEDPSRKIDVRVPFISDTGNADLEAKINDEINKKIQSTVSEAEKRARETQEAYLATGGTEEDMTPVMVTVDYQIKSSTSDILSFEISHTEVRANAFTENVFYNIHLITGMDITLRDLLGEDYISVVNESVRIQMEERQAAVPDTPIWFSADAGGFQGIRENQKFYINQNGNPVVSFEKYEIAPGCYGIQEFEIERQKNSNE